MTPRASADLIEAYVARLKAELAAVGASEADDLADEVRSMLIDAAGDDPDRAATEIAKLGEPAELAAGILAERGLSPEGGMSTADWWRMGIAVPIDIVVGVSVPVAAGVPLYLALTAEPRPDSPVMLGFWALFVVALAWPWYIWRPWRAGGSAATPGMTLTGITVVRAPGFWRVVRSVDLTSMGLARPKRLRAVAVVPIVLAAVLVGWSAQVSSQFLRGATVEGRIAELSGAESREWVTSETTRFYEAVHGGDHEAAVRQVTDIAWGPGGPLELLEARALADKPKSFRVHDQREVRPGVWSVRVTTTGASGTTYTDTVTLGFNLQVSHTGEYQGSWMITDIAGPDLCPTGT